jgi:hypothetical protein
VYDAYDAYDDVDDGQKSRLVFVVFVEFAVVEHKAMAQRTGGLQREPRTFQKRRTRAGKSFVFEDTMWLFRKGQIEFVDKSSQMAQLI